MIEAIFTPMIFSPAAHLFSLPRRKLSRHAGPPEYKPQTGNDMYFPADRLSIEPHPLALLAQ